MISPKGIISYYTNTGKRRKNNEDALLVFDELVAGQDLKECKIKDVPEAEGLLIVADGMGGHAKGEVASRKVLEILLKEKDKIKTASDLERALKLARNELEKIAEQHWEAEGLGTTLAGLVIREGKVLAFNVGDCRVYRYWDGKIERITKDHSYVEELVDKGEIKREEVRTNPYRNIVTSAVVGDGYATPLKVYTYEEELKEGSKYLICSDGFWEEFWENEMVELIEGGNFCQEALKKMQNKPLRDNVSFIFVDFKGD